MQRDFLELGGFGSSLGNNLTLSRRIIEPTTRMLDATRRWRTTNTPHARRASPKICRTFPPAKRDSGQLSLRIGDSGPMGRLLARGEGVVRNLTNPSPFAGEH